MPQGVSVGSTGDTHARAAFDYFGGQPCALEQEADDAVTYFAGADVAHDCRGDAVAAICFTSLTRRLPGDESGEMVILATFDYAPRLPRSMLAHSSSILSLSARRASASCHDSSMPRVGAGLSRHRLTQAEHS